MQQGPVAQRRAAANRLLKRLVRRLREACANGPVEALAEAEPPVLEPQLEDDSVDLFFGGEDEEGDAPADEAGAPAVVVGAEAAGGGVLAPMFVGQVEAQAHRDFRLATHSVDALQGAVGSAAVALVRTTDVLEEDVDREKVADCFASDGQAMLVGRNRLARQLGVHEQKVSNVSKTMTAVMFLTWLFKLRSSIGAVIAATLAAGGELLSFFHHIRLDETPMKVVIVEEDEEIRKVMEEIANGTRKRGEDVALLDEAYKDAAPSKLLGIENVIAVVAEIRGEVLVFKWRPPCPYMSLARTTGDAYYAALLRNDATLALEPLKKQFKISQRGVCSDGDSAITLSERARTKDATFEEDVSLKTWCSSHVAGNLREDVGDLRQGPQQSLKHLILSLRFGSYPKLLRMAYAMVFRKKANIVRNTVPSTVVRAQNERILDVWMPASKTTKVHLNH